MLDKKKFTEDVPRWFLHDEATVRNFRQLRLLVFVTFFGLFLIWMTFFSWVFWRLGPGGYSAQDAQKDRIALCEELDQNFKPALGWICPSIEEAGENGD